MNSYVRSKYLILVAANKPPELGRGGGGQCQTYGHPLYVFGAPESLMFFTRTLIYRPWALCYHCLSWHLAVVHDMSILRREMYRACVSLYEM